MRTIAQVEEAYAGRVRLVVKHAPVDVHRDALDAARAAACAQRQGKFWEYSELLFRNYYRLSAEYLQRYAREAGLDEAQFKEDWESGRCDARVDRDVEDGRTLGIMGTAPVVYVNGLVLVGDRPFSDFRVILDAETAPGILAGITN
jgi:protein-disulfide isomerase